MDWLPEAPPSFDEAFRLRLTELFAWRRDVRRFCNRPVLPALIEKLLDAAQLAPSVGNSQPWRWVRVVSQEKRQGVRANFLQANTVACQTHPDDRARLYARLKLEGIDQAPEQFAVFCDLSTTQGNGLGCRTMPEMLEYSTVGMISTFWLAARAEGLGVGWVSILEPNQIRTLLGVPDSWKLVAYLCVGWPQEEHLDSELERHGWQARTMAGRTIMVV